jgi:hypothetical protein
LNDRLDQVERKLDAAPCPPTVITEYPPARRRLFFPRCEPLFSCPPSCQTPEVFAPSEQR